MSTCILSGTESKKKKKKKKATYQLAKMLMHDYGGWVGG